MRLKFEGRMAEESGEPVGAAASDAAEEKDDSGSPD